MRTPRNDQLTETDRAKGRGQHVPERRCVVTGEVAPAERLVRLALGPDGTIAPDVLGKAPGRGAWIGVDRETIDAAQAKGKLKAALARAFRTGEVNPPADLGQRIADALERGALDRLGLEARGGTLLTGSERIATAAREGRVFLLIHAADAGEDGNRRLDQAQRVGSDSEGSGERGLVIAASRTILSLALGRENVVHIAIIDRGAAERVGEAIARWHAFIGFKAGDRPCESVSQGSSASAASGAAREQTTNEGFRADS